MPRITISYRREDSGVITGRIFDRLVTRYGRDSIFSDPARRRFSPARQSRARPEAMLCWRLAGRNGTSLDMHQ
jgi:hypothetical protein